MRKIPYASEIGNLMYAMLCMRPDICYAVGIVSRYQSNPGLKHWESVKHILKYLQRIRNYMLVYSGSDLMPIGYTDSNFQFDPNSRKSTTDSMFIMNGGAIVWRSVKQSCISDFTMEAESVAASEAVKEAVWLRNFLRDLKVILNLEQPMVVYCDNSGAVANSKEPKTIKRENTLKESFTSLERLWNVEI